ncbi:MAG: hypothetical protein COZ06_32480 [Armatimonadetes bacterium CG_4_10_14_3_um_filter_66_18]|nr:hypothetical protein [Armatimonadota bacterium]OIO98352.1 MAG: hypothetical protein AUJ96_21450 [Armatimonadetes bacterium CG2_30_66_41]PIY37615.1 MAG: hypothetical protein COZ06_32480 [Armatimonadetes bacterium CG_4_10_14_3_um_filter_66_18]NCO96261.1 hypothetical protein [Armatimonadota bacterium]NCQ28690.1 hypothetical protein [Armatimonadota bacterium]
MVTRWLCVEFLEYEPWAEPIWAARTHAGLDRVPRGCAMDELGVHIPTRREMIRRVVDRLGADCDALFATVKNRNPTHQVFTPDTEGRTIKIDANLRADILIGIDSLLSDVKTCCELMAKFLAEVARDAGSPISGDQIGKVLQRVVVEAGGDPSWFTALCQARNLFVHQATPYIAVDLSGEEEGRYDLLIMKEENLRNFDDETKFLRLADLNDIMDGFYLAKRALQQYLIRLYQEAGGGPRC